MKWCEGLYLQVFPTARLKLLQRLVFIINERIGPTIYYYLFRFVPGADPEGGAPGARPP
jgi:hypothetical protein